MQHLIVIAILCYATVCWSGPAYYEATGQTQVFNLTVGAKAGWQHDTPVRQRVKTHSLQIPSMIIMPMTNGINLKVNCMGQVMIFNAAGKRVCQASSSQQIRLSAGLYFAKLTTTTSSQITRFTVAR
jgi:hypothetical protein